MKTNPKSSVTRINSLYNSRHFFRFHLCANTAYEHTWSSSRSASQQKCCQNSLFLDQPKDSPTSVSSNVGSYEGSISTATLANSKTNRGYTPLLGTLLIVSKTRCEQHRTLHFCPKQGMTNSKYWDPTRCNANNHTSETQLRILQMAGLTIHVVVAKTRVDTPSFQMEGELARNASSSTMTEQELKY